MTVVATQQDQCDFCSSKAVVRRYQCMDFLAASKRAGVLYDGTRGTTGPTDLQFQSRSYWAACTACAAFVDAEDIEGLLAHAVKMLVDKGIRVAE